MYISNCRKIFLVLAHIVTALCISVRGDQQQLRGVTSRKENKDGRKLVNDINMLQDPYFDDVINEKAEQIRKSKAQQHRLRLSTKGPFSGPTVEMLGNGSSDPLQLVNQNNAENRIIGGGPTDPRSFYTILLYWNDVHWKWAGCGATLISNCYVVTAAHCMDDKNIDIEGIFVNAHAPYSNNDGLPFFFSFVQKITKHENYDSDSNEGDIAVIRMTECLDVNDFKPADPAKPEYEIESGEPVDIFGFGLTDDGGLDLPEVLQQANVPYIPNSQCQLYYGRDVKDDMFCGGYEQGGVDACQGDSGSGLLRAEANGQYTHLGVVSWGIGCGQRGNPGVYISIPYYFRWIHDTVCNDEDTEAGWCDPSTVGYSADASGNNGVVPGLTAARPTPQPTQAPQLTMPPTLPPGTSGCVPRGQTCVYGSDCCSGNCKAFSLSVKRCILSSTSQKGSYAAGMGGSGRRNKGGT